MRAGVVSVIVVAAGLAAAGCGGVVDVAGQASWVSDEVGACEEVVDEVAADATEFVQAGVWEMCMGDRGWECRNVEFDGQEQYRCFHDTRDVSFEHPYVD